MVELDEIRKMIEEMEFSFKHGKKDKWGMLKSQCFKMEKKLLYIRQGDKKNEEVKELLKRVKSLNKQIKYLMTISVKERVQPDQKMVEEHSKELDALNEMVKRPAKKREKLIEIEYFLLTIEKRIKDLQGRIKDLKIQNKNTKYEKKCLYRELEEVSDKNTEARESIEEELREKTYYYYQCEVELQECKMEVERLRRVMQKGRVASIEIKDLQPKRSKKVGTSVKKSKKGNHYYFNIMEELISDERNYFVIKELIETNPRFCNARNLKSELKEPIIMVVMDDLIRDLKLEIAGVSIDTLHVDYELALYKLLVIQSLELTPYEEKIVKSKKVELKELLEKSKRTLYPPKQEKKWNVTHLERNYKAYLEEQLATELHYSSRVNLSSIYLKSIQELEENEKQMIPKIDMQNSVFLHPTFALAGSKYALTVHYDETFNVYLRVHLLDTTFIPVDSFWSEEMEKELTQSSKRVKKFLSFKEGKDYPTITYQFKISMNGNVSEPHLYESRIHIDKVVQNRELLHYRENEELKTLVGTIRRVASDDTKELEFMSIPTIDAFLDFLLNMEMNRIFNEHDLPSLQSVETKLSDEDIVDLHGTIFYYLSKITKEEAHFIFYSLHEVCKSRFYTITPLEESEMELDPRSFLGYIHMRILKMHLKGRLTVEKREEFVTLLMELMEKLNQTNAYIDKSFQKRLAKENAKKE